MMGLGLYKVAQRCSNVFFNISFDKRIFHVELDQHARCKVFSRGKKELHVHFPSSITLEEVVPLQILFELSYSIFLYWLCGL